MTEVEELQYLIDHDPEFQEVVFLAHQYTNSIFEDEAEELVNLRKVCFPSWTIKWFFAKYKVIMGWSAMMGNILNKIHGKDSLDDPAIRPISGTDYGYVIYHDPQPWKVRVTLDKPTHETRIRETIVVRMIPSKVGGQVSKLTDAEFADIEFSLYYADVWVDSVSGTINPNLSGSKMAVRLYEEDTDNLFFEEELLVKDFKPDMLDKILKATFGI